MKRHLRYSGDEIETDRFAFNPRVPGDQSRQEVRNYSLLQRQFRISLQSFEQKRTLRHQRRNRNLELIHIDYIKLHFFDVYKVNEFKSQYRDEFGIVPVKFTDFNREGLFVIENEDKFRHFLDAVRLFIKLEDPAQSDEYPKKIRFIKSFDGFTREDVLNLEETKSHVVLDPFRNTEIYGVITEPLSYSLREYLIERNIEYNYDDASETIVLNHPDYETLIEIADNFDHLQSVSSRDSGVIRPSPFGEEIREFPFSVSNEGIDDLPIIGVIDTGVSDQTPLAPLLIRADPPFDLTRTDPFDDDADHGTGVATLAALGTTPIPEYEGEYQADARILPIKILDGSNGSINQNDVIGLIRRARHELGVRLFVLTITWTNPKKENAPPESYTYALDQMAAELDILLFISSGNNDNLLTGSGNIKNYPDSLNEPESYINTPADSMNHVSVGAVADDLNYDVVFNGFSRDRSFPAVYSRRFHYNFSDDKLKRSVKNRLLRSPVVLFEGGDYDIHTNRDVHGIKVVSSQDGQFFNIAPGTSYAAPFAANLAAKLMRQYPEISNMQSIKSLIINSADSPRLDDSFNNFDNPQKAAVTGYGVPDRTRCVYSDDHRVTFMIEDEIGDRQQKLYQLKLPEYLCHSNKNLGLLKVKATLCFVCNPLPDNQLAYCPQHITFGFFKNLSTEEIRGLKMKEKMVKQGWTQDYYNKVKLLSNAQKVTFNLSRDVIIQENNTIKIGVHSLLHGYINAADREVFRDREHPFSLAITLEDTRTELVRHESLYDELSAINELEAIGELDIDLEI